MGAKDEIGLKIRTMRKSRGMTQEELAKAIGQSPSSITMYETGRREPDFETLEALADVFNVSLFSLIPIASEEELNRPDYEDIPTTPEARMLAKGMDQMPEALRKAILTTLEYQYPTFFKEGNENDDT